jgi:transposase
MNELVTPISEPVYSRPVVRPADDWRGAPSKLTPAVRDFIVDAVRDGSHFAPACVGAGIDKTTAYKWIKRGEEDREKGRETDYSTFVDALVRAQAQSETRLVGKLQIHADSDWRAGAFILERRFKERWGKPENAAAPSTVITLPESVGTALVEALKMAAAIDVTPSKE